jgi:hypothetical protein
VEINVMQKAKKDGTPDEQITVENGAALTQTVFADETHAESVTFTTTGAWMSSITPNEQSWLSVDPDHGGAGTHTVNITLEPNSTGKDRSATVTITGGGASIPVAVTQGGTTEDGRSL